MKLAGGVRIVAEVAPAYEFVLSLASAAAGDLPAARALAGDAVCDAMDRFAGGSDYVWAHLLSVAHDLPPPRSVGALIDAVRRLHPHELRLRLMGFYVRWFRRATPPEVMVAAIDGDAEAQARFRATSYPDDLSWQSALAALLPLGPDETRRRLLWVLRAWRDAVDEPLIRPSLAVLEQEVAEVRGRLRARDPRDALTDLLGWEFVPEPGVAAVLLIPSRVVLRDPHVFDHHHLQFICYPASGDAVAPTDDLSGIATRLKAIGNDGRLRLLYAMARRPLTASQAATLLDTGVPNAMHHIEILRRAGLVRAIGRRQYQTLQPGLDELGRWLGAFPRQLLSKP